MKASSTSERAPSLAFLWDESFLWGIMAYRALEAAGLPFRLVRADEVRNGCLERCSVLFVPGGWASNKIKALGPGGIEAVRRFVEGGGTYIGFCGGAGLATMDGMGLLPVRRRPTKERVPSFSGPISLSLGEHPLWQGITEPIFHAWWPSQFVVDGGVSVLARYDEALPEAFSSDINVGDARSAGNWADLERTYGINLDPQRLAGEPAVLEGTFGRGRVLLSLVHFDTPDDLKGGSVLRNIWSHATGCALPFGTQGPASAVERSSSSDADVLADLVTEVNGLIDLGSRNFLWFRRNPWLLQWRRGVRGLEYCTLQVMVKEINGLLQQGEGTPAGIDKKLDRVRSLLLPFGESAKRLLVKERFAMQNDHITYERCDDPDIRSLRDKLFSTSKSHGGMFKEVANALDELLYALLADS